MKKKQLTIISEKVKKLLNQINMLDKFKLFFKKFWSVFLAVGGVIAYFLLRKKNKELFIEQTIDSRDKEIEKINSTRIEEKSLQAENEKKQKEALEAIEKQHNTNLQDLDQKKQQEIDKIVKENSNPSDLADKLSKATGFKVVFPEE